MHHSATDSLTERAAVPTPIPGPRTDRWTGRRGAEPHCETAREAAAEASRRPAAERAGWVLPAVLLASTLGHGALLAIVSLLPAPPVAIASTSEVTFEVVSPRRPEPPPAVEPLVEPPPPEPVAAAAPPRPAPPRTAPRLHAPPPPAPVLVAAAAPPAGWAHPEGEADAQLGGTVGGTGDTVGAAPALVEPAPAEVTRPGISRAELRRRLIGYIRNELHGFVNSRIEMPLVARREHLEGVVIVRLQLSRSGEILRVRLSRTSGHDVLDRAALASVRAITQVPAPPADLPWDPDEELPLPVRYQVQ